MSKKEKDVFERPHALTIVELESILMEKLKQIDQILISTVFSIEEYKRMNLFSNNDVMLCLGTLIELFHKTEQLRKRVKERIQQDDEIFIADSLEELQMIMDKLSFLVCGFGTSKLEQLFFITFGSSFCKESIEGDLSAFHKDKQCLLLRYAKPVGYKLIYWKNKLKPKDLLLEPKELCLDKHSYKRFAIELAPNWECFDMECNNSNKPFHLQVHGIRLVVHHEKSAKTVVITCILPDIPLEFLATSEYIVERKTQLSSHLDPSLSDRVISTLTLKDILVMGLEDVHLRSKLVMKEVKAVKEDKIDTTVKRFVEMNLMEQRQFLILLLTYPAEDNIQYITYLLYDLMSSAKSVDALDQQRMYDSFPMHLKTYFKDTMKHSIKISKDVFNKTESPKLSIEQQIVLMKTSESTKEKAFQKLKEIKSKSEEGGSSKAKQYLDGLLRIPFAQYQCEPVLTMVHSIRERFSQHQQSDKITGIQVPLFKPLSIHDILQAIQALHLEQFPKVSFLLPRLSLKSQKELVTIRKQTKDKGFQKREKEIPKTRETLIQWILDFFSSSAISASAKIDVLDGPCLFAGSLRRILTEYQQIEKEIAEVDTSIQKIEKVLDQSIHGHRFAKDQILKILSQWMTGEQTGYCFGFEGSPGVGKTSLAKNGLAKCLQSVDGITRPFAFIALGGSCNGSTLEGHSYTYVNSTWGRIADILMDAKCMNPIIYIDELDKVSKTEHGKEIIGILMHLIDSTQNNSFQDKYFSGIDLDLSKALFIFSYNDAQQIDSILLDRIHRIRFDNLTIDEKLTICKDFILPELQRKMGMHDQTICISDDMLRYIIDTYTYESGVRKLKEVLFDLYGEINLELLRLSEMKVPIVIDKDSLRKRYLQHSRKHHYEKIGEEAIIGLIHGLWASSYGKGGILPIQAKWFPSSSIMELKLTGNQGDVMKESMNVAKTVAWNSLDPICKEKWTERFEKYKSMHGIHVHCPDGSTPKDGPSAGTAIALCFYSLLTERAIAPTFAITGEITLQGNVTKIGGLQDKWLGGIQAGILHFLFPKENEDDAERFFEKYPEYRQHSTIQFSAISHLEEAIVLIFG